uniref:ARAD1B14256p n=1 Tax=Blastobotrys adeninivorans TaxID=409370 RepID=A0A060T6R4_BLAAD
MVQKWYTVPRTIARLSEQWCHSRKGSTMRQGVSRTSDKFYKNTNRWTITTDDFEQMVGLSDHIEDNTCFHDSLFLVAFTAHAQGLAAVSFPNRTLLRFHRVAPTESRAVPRGVERLTILFFCRIASGHNWRTKFYPARAIPSSRPHPGPTSSVGE